MTSTITPSLPCVGGKESFDPARLFRLGSRVGGEIDGRLF